tara:strand:- start:4073 stop:4519 length:447 start_codon:yes stop_codon:yes gene_type:complete
MTQTSNQFNLNVNKGELTAVYGGTPASMNAVVGASEASPIVPAQAVKLKDVAGAGIVITAVTATTDAVYGFVPYSLKTSSYLSEDNLKVSGDEAVMHMEAGAAIARGAELEFVVTGSKVQTQATGTVVGIALDKATADGDIIRVQIKL